MNNDILAPGTVLQGSRYSYTIKKVLGRGSFGITYQATITLQGELGAITSKVALKEFYMSDINGREGSQVTSGNKMGMVQDYRKKFVREALNLGEVNHENIINVMEVFEANGTVYYAMQYIEGGSLDDYIKKRGRLPENEVISLSIKLASALSALHSKGMLHLDIKPSNVMLTEDMNPVLIDFGLSKHFDEGGEPEASTKIGAGTPGYAPVEQSNYRVGNGIPVTMDVYALGATMFKMLTGLRPPEASLILNGIEDPAEKLSAAGVSDRLKAIVIKAMSALIRNRYQTMQEMLLAIKNDDSEEVIIEGKPQAQVVEVVSAIPAESNPEVSVEESTPVNSENADIENGAVAETEIPQEEESPEVKIGPDDAHPSPVKKSVQPAAEKASSISDNIVEGIPSPKEKNDSKKKAESGRKAENKNARKEVKLTSPSESEQVMQTPKENYSSQKDVEKNIPDIQIEVPAKKSNLPIIIGLVIGLIIVGAGVFFISGGDSSDEKKEAMEQTEISLPVSVEDMDYKTVLGEVKYTGEVNSENIPNGKGVAKFPNGSVYDGEWKDGNMTGESHYTLPNGDTFEGTWLNNEYENGRYTIKEDGSYYVGKFKNGEGYKEGGKWYEKSGKEIPW